MKVEDALQFITNALNAATLKGAFTLQDASNVALSINTVAKYIETQTIINIERESTENTKPDQQDFNRDPKPKYKLNK